jgi:DNA-binding transcriptional regulator LsrR (DeoR family)
MKTRTSLDVDMFALAAAYLRSENKLQEEIAEILKISQPEVSRLLKRAVKKKWLDYPAPHFNCTDEIREVWERAHARFFSSEKLLERLRAVEPAGAARLKKVSIFHAGSDGHFNRTVLPVMELIFAQASIVGVTWGRTVNGLVNVLRGHLPGPLRANHPIQFVPLCGEPLKDLNDHLEHSSSALAVNLHEIINGGRDAPSPSLLGIPASIPSSFRPAEVKTIQRFMRVFCGYAAIFGDHDVTPDDQALVHRLDTVLTSVGIVNPKGRGIFLTERVKLGEITEEELMQYVVGDLGGLIIPKGDLGPAASRRIETMNERWTGISLEELRRCADAAAQGPQPGVVVLATNKNRCEMVMRCIELGLINQLVINRDLAAELDSACAPAA